MMANGITINKRIRFWDKTPELFVINCDKPVLKSKTSTKIIINKVYDK